MKALLSLFQGPAGDVSSKRVSALALIAAGITMAFMHPEQGVAIGTLIGGALTIYGFQVVTKT